MAATWDEVSGVGNGQPQMVDIEWKGYGNALRTGFWKIFADELLMDAHLGPGDGLKMHKFVFAMFFGGMSDEVMSKIHSPAICHIGLDELFNGIDTVDIGIVRKLLEFTYSGRVSVPIKRLNEILCLAEAVGFDGLVDCIRVLEEQMDVGLQKTIKEEVIDIDENYDNASNCLLEESRVAIRNNQPAGRGRVEVNPRRRKSRKGLPVKIPYSVRSTRSCTADQSRLVESKSEAVKKNARKKDVPKVVSTSSEYSSEDVEDEVPYDPDESSQESESDEKTKERRTKKVTKIKKRLAVNGDGDKIKRKKKKVCLSCDQCDYVTTDKITYINHLSKHDPSIDVHLFECSICSKKFRSQNGFNCHVKMHSDTDKQFCCLHCSFTTGQKYSWQQHMAVIHKLDAKSGRELVAELRCEQCEFVCVAMHQLKAHRQRKHPIEKQFKCTECTYETICRNQLSRHISIVHRKERRYMCDTCGFRSQTPGGLKRHQRSHLGIKPFKCEECGMVYADRGRYKIHLLRHKNDEKPFVCHICAHSCRRRDNLGMHMKRIHNMTLEYENAINTIGRQEQFSAVVVMDEEHQQSTLTMSFVNEETVEKT